MSRSNAASMGTWSSMACASLGLKEMWGGCLRCSASAWQRADQIAALRVKLESGQSMPPKEWGAQRPLLINAAEDGRLSSNWHSQLINQGGSGKTN